MLRLVGHASAFSLGVCLIAAVPAMSRAQTVAPANVAIVNIQDAISATQEGKKEFDALQKKYAPVQADLKSRNDEVEKMTKDLQANGDKLTEGERARQVRELEAKQKDLQRRLEDAQNDFQQSQQGIVSRIGGKMLTVLESYAKSKGYDIVLDASSPQTPVLYAVPRTVITKDIVAAYDSQTPVK